MPRAAHTNAIRALRDLGPLRVWSLLVTVFGDLAPDCPLDGPTLSTIMDGIGVKPEATRVALHRLRSDGWIASKKIGRTSLHRLTDKGRTDSAAAHARIYGTPAQMDQSATVILMPDAEGAPDPTAFAQIATRVFIAATGTAIPQGAMPLCPREFPPWLGPQIETEALRMAYANLHIALAKIDRDLPGDTALSALETAVLRGMIVHAWRRLTLKHPNLPRAVHSDEWRGHDCRALVAALLNRFPRPALDHLKAT